MLVIAAAGILYTLALDGNQLGYYQDDGIYAVTGRSVADGTGYRITSVPGEPYQTKYPPVFPVLLSLVWFVSPVFPANAALFMVPSVLATILYLLAANRYFFEELSAAKKVALGAIALAAFNGRTVLLASSALSESVFTLLSILTLWLAAAYLRDPTIRNGIVCSILLILTILTRSSGLTIVLAIGIVALLQRKLRQTAGILTAGVLAFVLWTLWTRTHMLHSAENLFTFYVSYGGVFGERLGSLGLKTFLAFLARNAVGLIPLSIPLVTLGLSYAAIPQAAPALVLPGILFLFAAFGIIAWGFVLHMRRRFHLTHVYILCYLLLHLLWPYTAWDRFLMPLLPFLAFFLVSGIEELSRRLKRSRTLGSAAIAVAVVAWIFVNGSDIWRQIVRTPAFFAARDAQDKQLADWIQKNTQTDDVFLCYPDPRYFLLTQRKTFAAGISKEETSDAGEIVRRIVGFGSQYVIQDETNLRIPFHPQSGIDEYGPLLRARPDLFVPVFSAGAATIYRVSPNTVRPARSW